MIRVSTLDFNEKSILSYDLVETRSDLFDVFDITVTLTYSTI